ncbi:Pkinase-domain-containing protein [Epithele typhae]|uniref:Pkinase-domain-containing protein n=1 Tax=Epithele typhae TaxID=378194 RepID=UPI002007CFFA|nr:Pkinase-domain-containing protein [Epithele typhae]KAH9935953.1 Pkinase-domain-containing protein [Epithele typhae]
MPQAKQPFPRLKADGDPKMIGLWKVGRTIGKGSSGRVRLARHSKTGQYAAVKIVSKTALLSSRMTLGSLADEADRILHSIEREIVLMKLINHPHILRLYDVWETSSELYLILEYVEGGELFDHLCARGRLPAPEALAYFQQIIAAVDYCHRFHIAHRDLKPENLLLDGQRNIKVADFGMAVWQGPSDMLSTACGSPHYAAPEVVVGDAYDGTASDIWSCGVILFALLAGRLPFDDDDLGVLLEKVRLGRFHTPTDVDPRARDLIRRMLERDVKKRITIPEIVRHPFFVSHKPKLTQCDVPRLDAIARPLASATEVDPDIFANLRTLWPGAEDEELLRNLLDSKPSWEKGVYHLLLQYRATRLEDYDEEEERHEADRRAKRRKAKKAAAREEREQALAELPPRAGPPTPSRAITRNVVPTRSPSPSPTPGPSRARKPQLQAASDLLLLASADDTPEARPLDRPVQVPQIQLPQVEIASPRTIMQEIAQHVVATHGGRAPAPEPGPLEDLFSPVTGIPVNKGKGRSKGLEDDPFTERKETRPLTVHRRVKSAADKENAPSAHAASSTPGLSPSPVSTDDPFLLAPPPTVVERGRVKKRFSLLASPISTPASPAVFHRSSTPKQRWFNALFRVQPTTFRLLSTRSPSETHAVTRELLTCLGAVVGPPGNDSASGALSSAGVLGVKAQTDLQAEAEAMEEAHRYGHKHIQVLQQHTREVRFRVEIGKPSAAHAEAGYGLLVRLVLEKGAASGLKLLYVRMKKEWDLDELPVVGDGRLRMRSMDEERYVEVVVED